MTTTVSLVDVSVHLPGEPIGADHYAQFAESDDLRDNVMFRAPRLRHHVDPETSAIDMAEAYLASDEKDPELTRLSEEIIAAQETEIAFLKDWLARKAK